MQYVLADENRMKVLVEKIKPSKIPKRLQTYLTVDFITKLLLVARKNAILVVCDRLSKITHFVATMEGTLVEELVQLFIDNIWKLYRLSKSMVLDRGPQFAAEVTKELNKILGVETKLSITFHLQIDEQTE